MFHLGKRAATGLMAGLFLLAHAPEAARAQAAPANQTSGSTGSGTAPAVYGYNGTLAGGYLYGLAAYTQAQGQYLRDVQQARAAREEVVSAKLDNRRKRLEQWLWERENLPTLEDERERVKREEHRRAFDPPITEIWSGVALNALLADAAKIQAEGGTIDSDPLDQAVLAKINVSKGGGGHLAILRDGKLRWPLILKRKEFASLRQQIDELTARAIAEASRDEVEDDTLEELRRLRNELDRKLTARLRSNGEEEDWTPMLCIDAARFLSQYRDALRAFQRPDAGAFLTGKYAAQGKTVGDLVKNMTDKGLHFAPVTVGNEDAYNTLHRYLAAHDQKLQALKSPGAKR